MNSGIDFVIRIIVLYLLGAAIAFVISPEATGIYVAHAVKSYNVEMSK